MTAPSSVPVPASGLLFGAHAGRRDQPPAVDPLLALETLAGRTLDLRRQYLRWDDPLPSQSMVRDVYCGRTTVLSIACRRRDGSRLRWADVADGLHDADIERHARAIADLHTPVMLTLHHEPELADPEHGDAADYVRAWRRYVGRFRDHGAHRVDWVWTLSLKLFWRPDVEAAAWYPGNHVVDWIATNAYNTAAGGELPGWRTLGQLLGRFHTWAVPYGKPLMLSEYGSVEDPDDRTAKAGWLHDAMRTLTVDMPEFKAALYFHAQGERPWWVDSSPQAAAAFRCIAINALHP